MTDKCPLCGPLTEDDLDLDKVHKIYGEMDQDDLCDDCWLHLRTLHGGSDTLVEIDLPEPSGPASTQRGKPWPDKCLLCDLLSLIEPNKDRVFEVYHEMDDEDICKKCSTRFGDFLIKTMPLRKGR